MMTGPAARRPPIRIATQCNWATTRRISASWDMADRSSVPSATVEGMSEVSGHDRIDDVAEGDIIAVDRGSGEKPYKVVFKELTDDRYVVTLEGHGETFQLDLAPGTTVKRSLESKWESAQSPTPNPEG